MINPGQANVARAVTASAAGASTATDFCKTNHGFGGSSASSSTNHPLKSATSTGFGGTGGAGVVAAGMKT